MLLKKGRRYREGVEEKGEEQDDGSEEHAEDDVPLEAPPNDVLACLEWRHIPEEGIRGTARWIDGR